MEAYIYCGDVYCEECISQMKLDIPVPEDTDLEGGNESTWDSDDYPKGPYGDGGGEADSPQYCGQCQLFLENPLTTNGVAYVLELLDPYISGDDSDLTSDSCCQYIADRARDDGNGVLAEWAIFYAEEIVNNLR